MEIKVNGEARTWAAPSMSLYDVLKAMGMDPELTGIAVALNLSVVRRDQWPETTVRSGDEVEIISARQGG